jgi:hypothetical protein
VGKGVNVGGRDHYKRGDAEERVEVGKWNMMDGIPRPADSQVEYTLARGWELRLEAAAVGEFVKLPSTCGKGGVGMKGVVLGGETEGRKGLNGAGRLVRVTESIEVSAGGWSSVVQAERVTGVSASHGVGAVVGHLMARSGNWDGS